jgi:hypothetical protein
VAIAGVTSVAYFFSAIKRKCMAFFNRTAIHREKAQANLRSVALSKPKTGATFELNRATQVLRPILLAAVPVRKSPYIRGHKQRRRWSRNEILSWSCLGLIGGSALVAFLLLVS